MSKPLKVALWLCIFSLGIFSLAACGNGEQDNPDAGEDGGSERSPLDERLSAGEVRAGVVEEASELLSGVEAHGWIGDFKLYNDQVAFIVQNPLEARGWGPYGGSLLDADRIRPEGQTGNEIFQEMFTNVEYLTLRPDSGEVIHDGADGQAAVVRIRGQHRGLPLIDAALNGALTPQDLELEQDYILEANASHLRVVTRLSVRSGAGLNLSVGDVLLNGDRSADFVPGPGMLDENMPAGQLPYFAGTSTDSCTLYAAAEGDLESSFSVEGITPLGAGRGLAPGPNDNEPTLEIARILIVGGGGVDDCLRRFRQLRGETTGLGLVQGQVQRADGSPEVGAVVLAHDGDLAPGADVVNQTYTDLQGAFELELPAGHYTVEIQAAARPALISESLVVNADGQTPVTLTMASPAELAYVCEEVDSEGQSLGSVPCKLSFQTGHDAAMGAATNTSLLTFGASGQGIVDIPPGDWTLTISRGWEYSILRQNLTLVADQREEVNAELFRQVDTTGYVAADLHNHSARSADSDYELKDKVGSNLCEGLELLVATDHDCQTDLAPFAQELAELLSTDFAPWIRLVVGNEVSPLYGHFSTFPLPTHPTGWIYWQIPWVTYDEDGLYVDVIEFPDLWQRSRDLGAQVINVAHPLRDTGWFSYLGFEPPTIMPELASLPSEKFSADFDTLELLNGKDTNTMLNETIFLWSYLNNRGLFKTAIGVSDSHGRTAEAGFGRTLIAVTNDDPAELNIDEVWSNLKANKAVMGGGIFITISVAEANMGEEIQQTSPVPVHIQAQAADWVPVQQVDLWVNGEIHSTHILADYGEADPDHPAIRLDTVVEVETTSDIWVAAVAYGQDSDRLNPVFRSCRPVGMTNAIRVDVDNNGFTPPGP